jgi:hypothetical protein
VNSGASGYTPGVITHEYLDVELRAPAAFITLNRPDQRNPLSLDLMRELAGALEALAGDESVRAMPGRGSRPGTISRSSSTGRSRTSARSSPPARA